MPNQRQTATIVFDGKGGASGFTQAIVAAAADPASGQPAAPSADGLFWHPLIPLGKFTHQQYGEFETTAADAAEMIANFNSGLPGPKGIPIDQNAEHLTRGDGAYGWVKSLEIRENTLWGGIEWTTDGVAAVASNRLPYVSPYWVTSTQPHPTYNARNLIIAVALCTRPFFFSQPELHVAASEFVQVPISDTTPDAQSEGGIPMPSPLAEDARKKYEAANGSVTDEEWTKLTKDFATDDDWKEFIAGLADVKTDTKTEPKVEPNTETAAEPKAKTEPNTESEPVADIDALKQAKADAEARLAEAVNKLAEAETRASAAEQSTEQLAERVATLEAERNEARAREEIAATDLGSGQRYSPVAVDLLVAQRLNPNAESVAAIEAHMKDHGGKMETVIFGEYPKLTVVAATSGTMPDAEWWTNKKTTIPADTIAATEAAAKKDSITYREAYDRVIDLRNAG